MKINLNSKELLLKLQFLSGVIGNNNTMPILDSFHFDINEERLIITASDLDNTISTEFKCASNVDAKICIPSRMLIDILKLLPSQPIVIEIQENNAIQIVSDSGNYQLSYSDGEDFPKPKQIENPGKFEIAADIILNAINKTVFACGNDDLRPILNGVLFQMKTDRLNFVATDASRLAVYTRKDIQSESEFEFIVPKKPLSVLKTILGSVAENVIVEYNQNNVSFQFEEYLLICRLIDGKYPNYEAVIPKENPNTFMLDTQALVSALRRVSLFSNKSNHQIKVVKKGTSLELMAEDVDYSTNGKEVLTCASDGDDILMGFNSRFLTETLNNVDTERVMVKTSAPNRAGIVVPMDIDTDQEELLMLVMPLALT